MQLTSLSLALTRAGLGGFSPSSLFLYGEQGVWYEPSLTNGTCFQDAAGTTPVTAVEQPVGLMLDKSKGLVLGPELVANGTFDTNVAGWTTNTGFATITWEAGAARFIGTFAEFAVMRSSAFPTVVGKTYVATAQVLENTGARWVLFATTSGGTAVAFGSSYTGAGLASLVFTATTASTIIEVRNATGATTNRLIDNISVRELPGNHAYQTTSTSRPVLSARYNLLTKTEQFDDAVWTKTNVTTSQNSITDDATSGGHYVSHNLASAIPTTIRATASVEFKAGTANYAYLALTDSGNRWIVAVVDLSAGAITQTAQAGANSILESRSISDIGDGWYRVSITGQNPASGTFANMRVGLVPSAAGNIFSSGAVVTYVGSGGTVLVRNASTIFTLPTSIPYQRVNTATDYDADPAKFKPYLRFDGVDDFLVTNSIDFTSTDKMTVFAGVRKLSDAALAAIAELSTTTNNNGSFGIYGPRYLGVVLGDYGFISKGTLAADIGSENSTHRSPTTNVLAGIGDISGDSTILRVDGTQAASSTADQGTGNFGNYPLYIGRRGGTTLPFNGQLYSLIVRGAQTSDTQVSQTETWVNGKTGAY